MQFISLISQVVTHYSKEEISGALEEAGSRAVSGNQYAAAKKHASMGSAGLHITKDHGVRRRTTDETIDYVLRFIFSTKNTGKHFRTHLRHLHLEFLFVSCSKHGIRHKATADVQRGYPGPSKDPEKGHAPENGRGFNFKDRGDCPTLCFHQADNSTENHQASDIRESKDPARAGRN